MKSLFAFIFLLITVIFVSCNGDSKVVVLTKDNFEATVTDGINLVEFFAPWCGHCKKLAPTWEQLAKETDNFLVGKVDCTQEKEVCDSQGVRGYPTIKLFANGSKYDYSGARTIESFVKFVEEHAKKDEL